MTYLSPPWKQVKSRMRGKKVSRRGFIKMSAAAVGTTAVGIYAFPKGIERVDAAGPGVLRITRTYPRQRVARLSDLREGEPLDFQYPAEEQRNFLIKLGTPALDGVGPGQDVVAFNYTCPHMGGPLQGTYRHDFKMLGPCPFHYSRFDLSKNGVMILGQATQSLPQIMLEVEGSDVYAVGVTGLVYGFRDNLAHQLTPNPHLGRGVTNG
ncbi:MAG: arsenate reductase (azurin) small subunit [Dehalococcoidia bacterium]